MKMKVEIPSWGKKISVRGLPDLYASTDIRKRSATPGGIDNLALTSKDTFIIPGHGEFTVSFEGYFRVARSNPTTKDWATAEWQVNMVDMRLTGASKTLGKMNVRLNEGVVSAGQVFAAGASASAAACRIAVAATFEIEELGLTVFNKEPILLMNDAIDSVPPVEDPNGEAHIYRLPLFDVKRPSGSAVAYLTRLRYTVGNYITKEQAKKWRSL